MRDIIAYLFKEKLAFLIVNLFAIVISLSTIILLGANAVNVRGEISYSTLVIVVINALFLIIKTTLNIFSLIVQYKYNTTEEEKISNRVRSFKDILDKEDFRL